MSRVTRKLFVVIATGFRNSRRISRQRRVIFNLRSAGWYGSVTPLIRIVCGFQRGDDSAALRRSGAPSLTRIFVSKSRPAENPRYS
jgi:hypothetical protein